MDRCGADNYCVVVNNGFRLGLKKNVTALSIWPLGTKTKKTDIASSKSLNAKKVQCTRTGYVCQVA